MVMLTISTPESTAGVLVKLVVEVAVLKCGELVLRSISSLVECKNLGSKGCKVAKVGLDRELSPSIGGGVVRFINQEETFPQTSFAIFKQ